MRRASGSPIAGIVPIARIVPIALPLLLLLLLLLPAPAARAHKASDAYLRLTVVGHEVTLRFDVALRDLDRDLALDADEDGALRWGEVRERAAEIAALAEAGAEVAVRDTRGEACAPLAPGALQLARHSDGRYAALGRAWRCAAAPARLSLAYGLFADTDPTHRGILVHAAPGGARTFVLAPGVQPVSLALNRDGSETGGGGDGGDSGESSRAGLGTIFLDGVHHIWIGVDHVLFLVTLLLPAVLVRAPAGGWRAAAAGRPVAVEIVGVVTAFTVAHSITLGLAAFDVLDPPSRWVESLIAASVLLAALNNLRPVLVRARWRLTFVFGLVHGFGFAGALKDLGLARDDLVAPLLAFNLGVEAGQLAIVAVLVPAAWAARRWAAYPRWVLGGGSAAVAVLASAWLVERALDVPWPAMVAALAR